MQLKMDNHGVRRLSVSRVTPSPAPAEENVKVKLSFLDAPWVATWPVQQVFLYERGSGEEFAAVVKRLKESLAAALALYLPLAGELAYVEDTRDLVVDCSDPGVAFFVAEAEAVDPGDEMEAESLLPELDARVLPAPVMTVQATRLIAGGGMALGVSALHAVVDGRAFVLFLDTWFSISRGGASPVSVSKSLPMPYYDRDAIARAHPCGDELARHVISKVAPNLPVAIMTDGCFTKNSQLGRQTIVLDPADIRRLKRRIDAIVSSSSLSSTTTKSSAKPVSTFVALSALSWTAFVHAKGLAAGDDTHLLFQVDLRARLRPPVAAGYFGNCVRGCVASADAGELLDEATGLLRAARAITAALREVTAAAPVAGLGAWIERVMGLPAARVVSVGGSPLFRLYQTPDFGLGMPGTVVPVYMPGSPETPGHGDDDRVGRVVLSGGRREGDVHLSVSLRPVVLMDGFKNHIRSSTATMIIRPKF
ncbi:hypothetical protein BS78_K289400 [Paspalum vaginatum]|uniref:Uncharacterized protein n=1 Tax=Paspalum vaginatum TaxID=158149 RepID=A0A9W7XAL1_9POAL|nr:hypothetical protein BS78_K289400 [Paspalum vaginatum]